MFLCILQSVANKCIHFKYPRYFSILALLLLFSCSVMSDSETPWTAAYQASLSFTISQSFLKLMSIKLVMPSNHLILCHPLFLLPSIFPSIRVFSNESTRTQGVLKESECESVSCSVVSDPATAWTLAHQALLSMEFSRQE